MIVLASARVMMLSVAYNFGFLSLPSILQIFYPEILFQSPKLSIAFTKFQFIKFDLLSNLFKVFKCRIVVS
jgi:hypothetical protein